MRDGDGKYFGKRLGYCRQLFSFSSQEKTEGYFRTMRKYQDVIVQYT